LGNLLFRQPLFFSSLEGFFLQFVGFLATQKTGLGELFSSVCSNFKGRKTKGAVTRLPNEPGAEKPARLPNN